MSNYKKRLGAAIVAVAASLALVGGAAAVSTTDDGAGNGLYVSVEKPAKKANALRGNGL